MLVWGNFVSRCDMSVHTFLSAVPGCWPTFILECLSERSHHRFRWQSTTEDKAFNSGNCWSFVLGELHSFAVVSTVEKAKCCCCCYALQGCQVAKGMNKMCCQTGSQMYCLKEWVVDFDVPGGRRGKRLNRTNIFKAWSAGSKARYNVWYVVLSNGDSECCTAAESAIEQADSFANEGCH